MQNDLYLEKDGAIATLVINRADQRNAFSLDMFKQLPSLLTEAAEDSSIKVLILRGVDNRAFSAGADIKEFMDNRLSQQKAKNYNDHALAAIEQLYRFPKPTIALIRKLAIGGGLELAMSCDFRIASTDSKFGITAARLGIIYNLRSTKRLLNVIGPVKTKELLYTGKLIKAEEAEELGIVQQLHEGDAANEAAWSFAQELAAVSSTAMHGNKKVIQAIIDGAQSEDEQMASLILDSFESDDYKEGIQAFLEKRQPNFT
ncbi:enoyl-CoA hydratase/isomerase family protein [Planococcus shenhongbingii]|uniref:Enoyl-CoA hydratase/isomerase family protein n=1 Tax=Planococcus shenhongbingii TaxID=3058398 RepID=A0ABT8NEN6_9BACL|nr:MULTISPECIES: enoyl-CoA hydratase/isomerase family protein [unclassified Planococcus (in: firmicutes)]MDN7246333.1 enoyl-CoA hydratase/isomerase family protein [Planococcus sp. N017]WKA59339.1 enoyl-CoA hydratase/isomerase family protein [Planococcus sp. N016]